MAGDEEKKKKKKSKKGEKAEKADEAPPAAEEQAPPPEPEPSPPAPEDAPQEEAPPADAPPAEEGAPAEEAPPAEGAEVAEGEEALEPPPAPKKKPKFFVHWNRKKARFYDYNWDYGGNYYSSLVRYIDVRAGDYPRRMAFAERGIRSNVQRRTLPDMRTSVLLDDVRKSIKNFEISQKTYMK